MIKVEAMFMDGNGNPVVMDNDIRIAAHDTCEELSGEATELLILSMLAPSDELGAQMAFTCSSKMLGAAMMHAITHVNNGESLSSDTVKIDPAVVEKLLSVPEGMKWEGYEEIINLHAGTVPTCSGPVEAEINDESIEALINSVFGDAAKDGQS